MFSKGKTQCPNCKSRINGTFEVQNFIRKLIFIDCFVCGYKFKKDKVIEEKSKQEKLI